MSNVLIVEDHHDTAQLLERMLRYTGHEAVAVPTGSEALRLLSLRRPDVVILDCNMPDMDGMDVLRVIRSEASTRTLPVIVYTADVSPACEDQARQLGAQAFLIKGSAPWDAVLTAIQRHAGGPAEG